MKILFIGDIVGDCGRRMTLKTMRQLKEQHRFDMIIANGENIAERNGISEAIYRELLLAGVDVVTMGNHTWDTREIYRFIDDTDQLVRPANYPLGTPGRLSLIHI